MQFGSSDNTGRFKGVDDSTEQFGEGDNMQSVTLDDGSRVVVGIRASTVTFTKQ